MCVHNIQLCSKTKYNHGVMVQTSFPFLLFHSLHPIPSLFFHFLFSTPISLFLFRFLLFVLPFRYSLLPMYFLFTILFFRFPFSIFLFYLFLITFGQKNHYCNQHTDENVTKFVSYLLVIYLF